jgi:hypothetical protein
MIDLLEPWQQVTAEQAWRFESEVRRELSSGHILSGKALRAVARRQDCDDVLFEIDGGGCAVVHLSWSSETNSKWPTTETYASLADWTLRRMKPDHDEFVADG